MLNPYYYEWILNRHDAIQPFFGGIFFGKQPWLECSYGMDDITYPFYNSLIFMDEIIPVAYLSKIFWHSTLQDHIIVQFLGIHSLLCFSLQGSFAALISQKIIENNFLKIVSIACCCMMPALFQRCFTHCTLTAHYILLAAFALFLFRKSLSRKR